MKDSLFVTTIFFLFVSVTFLLCAEEKEVTLEGVVVTGTRDVQEIRKIPANVTVITKEEIERSYAQTSVDLLRSQAGVVVNDLRGTGKSVFMDIRGLVRWSPQYPRSGRREKSE
jgi:outer membrane cobalamin receptor